MQKKYKTVAILFLSLVLLYLLFIPKKTHLPALDQANLTLQKLDGIGAGTIPLGEDEKEELYAMLEVVKRSRIPTIATEGSANGRAFYNISLYARDTGEGVQVLVVLDGGRSFAAIKKNGASFHTIIRNGEDLIGFVKKNGGEVEGEEKE